MFENVLILFVYVVGSLDGFRIVGWILFFRFWNILGYRFRVVFVVVEKFYVILVFIFLYIICVFIEKIGFWLCYVGNNSE